ncbi:MAG: PDZ domain-containing protein, partial [Ignavibacteria bacterium]|nr:PDZ domain-containing protein [Ignavibacteria bacterium]
ARGVLVQSVQKGGGGDDAGLKAGDVILAVDGKEVNASNELQVIINSKRPGDVVKLTIFRDGKTMEKEVTLKPRQDENKETSSVDRKDDSGNRGISTRTVKSLGITVSDVPSSVKEKLNISSGAYVTSVDRYSETYQRGIGEGFVIIEANKKKISGPSDLEDAIADKKEGDSVLLKVIDKSGMERIVAVRVQ